MFGAWCLARTGLAERALRTHMGRPPCRGVLRERGGRPTPHVWGTSEGRKCTGGGTPDVAYARRGLLLLAPPGGQPLVERLGANRPPPLSTMVEGLASPASHA